MRRPRTQWAERGDGRLAFAVWGEGDQDLVFVPGVFSHLELTWGDPAWARFAQALGSFARVVTYDKRGTGVSDPLTRAPTIQERLDDLVAVMEAAGIAGPAALLGFSDGAAIASCLAATRPERVSALVLYGAALGGVRSREQPWGMPEGTLHRVDDALDRWGSGSSLALFAPSIATPVQRRLWAFVERASVAPDTLRLVVHGWREADITPALAAIRCPTLVLHRRDDIVPVEGGRRIAELVPGAEYVELDGCDHLPWIADSSTLYDEIARFLVGRRAGPVEDVVTATVLYTDIVGSTERLVREGDRAWGRRLAAHDEVVRDELARTGGRELSTTGDGFLAAFEEPAGAADCALAVADRVRGLGLEVRAGLHTGECEVDGLSLKGLTLHLGARVMSAADAGQVLASAPTAELLRALGTPVVSRGVRRLKGIPGELELFAVERRTTSLPPGAAVPPQVGLLDSVQVRAMTAVPPVARAALRLLRPPAGR